KLVATGLRKFGAVIGDFAEIGCNSVINPGSMIGRRSIVYPLTSFSGYLPAESVLKTRQQQVVVKRM
ncbi:MAG TPA: UDP-N-acetylglucosamine diphosphorylase, partial [Prosthecobacter sp.]|nr:UDP-N-acetylglucosamine diphosphorylase [Prosthecobacter sp.]